EQNITKDACNWLIRQQQKNGSWLATPWSDNAANDRRTALLTARVSLELARTNDNSNLETTKSLKQAMEYLTTVVDQIDEPYLLACYAQTAMKLGDNVIATKTIDRLTKLAHKKADTSYWTLETNTPFYGWGLAGQIETTALVLETLAQPTSLDTQNTAHKNQLIDQGLLFLLQNKDRYGVWYSGQATVNVLNTLLTIISKQELGFSTSNIGEIYVNGVLVKSLELPPANEPANPISFELTPFLTSTNPQIEVRNVRGNAQIVNNYYLPWLIPTVIPTVIPISVTIADLISTAIFTTTSKATSTGIATPTLIPTVTTTQPQEFSNRELRLLVNFDKTQAKVGEEITCQVQAERIGHRGYGMMLAEIGLPPGAELDRSSLEKAAIDSGWAINHYDVLPDKLILYLWPRAGGVNFSFKFSERFAMTALTVRSVLYDYYNPEAKVTIAPVKFTVLQK
ncbi:MAG: hypothetical protein FD167_3888, partial [bacterium]